MVLYNFRVRKKCSRRIQ